MLDCSRVAKWELMDVYVLYVLMTMVNIWRFPFWKMGHQTTVLKPMVLGIPDFKNPPNKNGGLKHVQIYIYIHGYITHISRNQIEHGVLVHV